MIHNELLHMTSSNGNIFRVTDLFMRGIHRSPDSPHKVDIHNKFGTHDPIEHTDNFEYGLIVFFLVLYRKIYHILKLNITATRTTILLH